MTTNTFVFFTGGKLVYRWISWYSNSLLFRRSRQNSYLLCTLLFV